MVTCLGEVILDLVCEQRLGPDDRPGPFTANHGGAPANVAALLARSGVPAALIGGVGDDRWGRWLRAGLEADGVETGWLEEVEGLKTPIAVITFDLEGEPTFAVHGEDVGPAMEACRPRLDQALDQSGALVIGANTMVGPIEREVTREAVRLARGKDVTVLIDPNHRPGRWDEEATAVEYTRELVALSDVVKTNRVEAELLTGLGDPASSAAALLELGPALAVITDGPGEVVVRGESQGEFTPVPTEVVSPLGAGDAFMAGLVAGLAKADLDLTKAIDLVPGACELAGKVCLGWEARP